MLLSSITGSAAGFRPTVNQPMRAPDVFDDFWRCLRMASFYAAPDATILPRWTSYQCPRIARPIAKIGSAELTTPTTETGSIAASTSQAGRGDDTERHRQSH